MNYRVIEMFIFIYLFVFVTFVTLLVVILLIAPLLSAGYIYHDSPFVRFHCRRIINTNYLVFIVSASLL